MKRMFLKAFMLLFFVNITSSVLAQDYGFIEPNHVEQYLGVHCEVSVDLDNDPVQGGYLKYTIPAPREGVSFIQGPAGCYLSNNLGSTVDIYVRRVQLELALSDLPYAQVPFELFVNLWKDPHGGTTSSSGESTEQCFYYVVFEINTLN